MFKKILTMLLACSLCFSTVPATVSAGTWDDLEITGGNNNESYPVEADISDEADVPDDEDEDDACSISPEDLCVKPAKKIMAKGSSFKITVAMQEGSIFEELSDEEWDALYEHDVASVEFKSNKPSVAKVNSQGKVTAKKKGNCSITTTIYLVDGTAWPFRTRVFVSR